MSGMKKEKAESQPVAAVDAETQADAVEARRKPRPKAAKPKPMRRFWKPKRSLPSVEWDPKAGPIDPETKQPKGRARFEFYRGMFQTDDQELAEYLLKQGYEELDAGETAPSVAPLDDVPDPDSLPNPMGSFQPMEPGTVQGLRDLGINVPMRGG
jgi:hypothetical protein